MRLSSPTSSAIPKPRTPASTAKRSSIWGANSYGSVCVTPHNSCGCRRPPADSPQSKCSRFCAASSPQDSIKQTGTHTPRPHDAEPESSHRTPTKAPRPHSGVAKKSGSRATLRSRSEIGTGLGERLCRSTGLSTDPRHFGGFATPWPMIAMLNTLTWGSSICRGGREPMPHRQRQFLKALLLCFLFSLVATAWIYVLYNSPH